MAKIRHKARRKFSDPSGAKKKGAGAKKRFPGELEFKRQMACILKVAGYTHSQIASSLGEGKGTIDEWATSPEFQEYFFKVTETLTDSAMTLLQSYSIEAIQEVVRVLRTTDDDAMVMKAAEFITDRGGLPKLSRVQSEAKSEQTKRDEVEFTTDGIVDKLRNASPEILERAALVAEEFEKLLAEHAQEQNSKAGVEEPSGNPETSG